MGRVKKARKVRTAIRLRQTDERLKLSPQAVKEDAQKKQQGLITVDKEKGLLEHQKNVIDKTQEHSALFFEYNAQLGPPYRVLMDTNFINFAIQHKTDIFKGMMDCLMAKVIPTVTDCVVAELEKMGHKYRLALRLAKDPRVVRLTCTHKGNYADDCLVQRITQHRCYVVATSDRELKRRIRKVPGVPIMFVTQHQFSIERMPDAVSAVPFSNYKLKKGILGGGGK
eukprot:Protomagalhaensia_sp_Gyna_25__5422@NODE_704_length_2805_cov_12_905640_g549_i0_p2_GENE_NODE_704_length_2805_cov_12_905640_g549_i0NODE_704_length_2805_cov_12_905640_g549_i0_p2_ORF_typecomplete_len226_score36_48Fcf1/PF04900_12/7_2e03Fcf1/PF04900_12/3_8e34PIN_9/PF18477_1/1_7e03PIN_9/PF18477_1/9e13NYN_YacP/PF05991_11/0_00058Phage_Gp23/PF10669_9/0_17_NODE_704_length_2805_cov_12_905640_g549_i020862763